MRGVELGEGDGIHIVRYEREAESFELATRWLVDASGRAGILKRKLGLAVDNDHDVNSAWFRIGARIDVNDWSGNESWRERCDPPDRWLSTNHLVGEGYWVWLIPLASGSHSVGIVADGRIHPLRRINSFERAMEWLREFQPLLADDIESKRDKLQDFAFLKHFSYGCRQLFSGSRWAITGEAGVFLDPFYSPGGDFIAISNTYITDLVARDRAGQPVAPYARIYEQFFMSFHESTMSLYRDQYRIFGDPEVLPVKVIWDYTYYWGVLCQLFFQRRLTDLPMLSSLRSELTGEHGAQFRDAGLHAELVGAKQAPQPPGNSRPGSPRLVRRTEPRPARLARRRCVCSADTETTHQLEELAREIVIVACSENPGLDAGAVLGLIEDRGAVGPGGMLVESAA